MASCFFMRVNQLHELVQSRGFVRRATAVELSSIVESVPERPAVGKEMDDKAATTAAAAAAEATNAVDERKTETGSVEVRLLPPSCDEECLSHNLRSGTRLFGTNLRHLSIV